MSEVLSLLSSIYRGVPLPYHLHKHICMSFSCSSLLFFPFFTVLLSIDINKNNCILNLSFNSSGKSLYNSNGTGFKESFSREIV
ncbi:MAG: hypothetical protein [Inoviridae sp.]|nr:MAG: hypothetical protein [Inoviridae sp.]